MKKENSDLKTREEQYSVSLRYRDEHGQEPLGLMLNQAWYDDPRRLTFTFSRYKFVSRILDGRKNVLEVGCGDAFASRIVLQAVDALSVTDFDAVFLDDIRARQLSRWHYKTIFQHDFLGTEPLPEKYDGMYALDVLEHISSGQEDQFLRHIVQGLDEHGVLIIGMPSLESQNYASAISKQGHVNCQSLPQLKETMERYFHTVFMFCMNDEVVHTGFHKMAHYLFAVCCEKRKLEG
jgi:2-polyprenyl-3-methyl-5-hydroxy-6-metoxy-1,4-benzoquinol methylase